MAKKKADDSGIVPLCREFLLAANDKSDGKIFENWPRFDPRSHEGVDVQRCKALLADGFFQATFPAQLHQDEIGYQALLKSGVQLGQVKKALKEEGLSVLANILGRAAHTAKELKWTP